MSSVRKALTPEERIVLKWWRERLPNEDMPLSILDVDVDGFYEGHLKTEDMVGIVVVLPDSSERPTDDEAISRLMNALETILERCLGDLSYVEKQKVVLVLANRENYFGDNYYYSGKAKEDLTPMLTALMNSIFCSSDTGTTDSRLEGAEGVVAREVMDDDTEAFETLGCTISFIEEAEPEVEFEDDATHSIQIEFLTGSSIVTYLGDILRKLDKNSPFLRYL